MSRNEGKSKRALRGRAGRMQGGRGSGRASTGAVRLWGRHAVEAALLNPERKHRKLWATREGVASLDGELPADFPIEYAQAADLGRLVARDAPHQGLVLECDSLPDVWLEEVLDGDPARPLVVLDQVTDPHNVGAILRSAAAFNACALLTQDRHAPPESGTVAKSASGALEEVAEAGYWRIGLDGTGQSTLADALPAGPVALVLGAEGEGMRHNIVQHCDAIARLPIAEAMESLNVSNAAAIALYAVATRVTGE